MKNQKLSDEVLFLFYRGCRTLRHGAMDNCEACLSYLKFQEALSDRVRFLFRMVFHHGLLWTSVTPMLLNQNNLGELGCTHYRLGVTERHPGSSGPPAPSVTHTPPSPYLTGPLPDTSQPTAPVLLFCWSLCCIQVVQDAANLPSPVPRPSPSKSFPFSNSQLPDRQRQPLGGYLPPCRATSPARSLFKV